MILVQFEEFDGRISLSIEGHAGCGEVGRDIVCAAASILWATARERVSKLCPNVVRREEAGRALLVVPEGYSGQVREVFETILEGFSLLQKKYPQIFLKRGF